MVTKKKKGAATMRTLAAGRGKARKEAEPMIRMGVYVPRALRKRAKIAAVQRGVSLSAFVIEAVERLLEEG